MKRYHKNVFFPAHYHDELRQYNNILNISDWKYSKHCIDNIKMRLIDIEAVLKFIKDISLEYSNIFEYYKIDDKIVKACYRVKYNDSIDLILVISADKTIITIYVNNFDDEHYTLKTSQYNKE